MRTQTPPLKPAGDALQDALASVMQEQLNAHVDDIAQQAMATARQNMASIVGTAADQRAQGASAMRDYAPVHVLPTARIVAGLSLGIAVVAAAFTWRCVRRR